MVVTARNIKKTDGVSHLHCLKRSKTDNLVSALYIYSCSLLLEPQLTEANNVSVCVCVSVCAMDLDCLKCRHLQLMEMLNISILCCGNIKVRHPKWAEVYFRLSHHGRRSRPCRGLLCLCFICSQVRQKYKLYKWKHYFQNTSGLFVLQKNIKI